MTGGVQAFRQEVQRYKKTYIQDERKFVKALPRQMAPERGREGRELTSPRKHGKI